MVTFKKKKVIKKNYKKVYVRLDIVSVTGGEPESDEQFCNRSPAYREMSISSHYVLARPKNGYNYEEVTVPDYDDSKFENDFKFLYAIIVGYSSGDTFGQSFGHVTIPFAFADYEEANKVAREIKTKNHDRIDKRYGNGKYGVYKSWDGYFENIEYVEVKELTLTNKHLYFSKE